MAKLTLAMNLLYWTIRFAHYFSFEEYLSLVQSYHIKEKDFLHLVKLSSLLFDFQLYAAPAGLKMQIKKWFNHAGEQDLQINFTTLQWTCQMLQIFSRNLNSFISSFMHISPDFVHIFLPKIFAGFLSCVVRILLCKEFCPFLRLNWSCLKHLNLDRMGDVEGFC